MKKKPVEQLRTQPIKELFLKLVKAEKELVILSNDLGTGKLKDFHQCRRKKREIARLKTIIGEKKFRQEVKEEKKQLPKGKK